MKETQDSKLRVHSSGSNRGVRGSSERNGGWCGSTQTSSNGILNSVSNVTVSYLYELHGCAFDYCMFLICELFVFLLLELGQAACKGQNGFVAPSASHFTGGTMSQQPSSHR